MTKLCKLARKHETDKGGQHYRYGGGDSDTCHNYTPVYHRLFDGKEDKITSVLEIGVHAGSSLRMWKEYFPNAFILGIDCNSDCLRHKEHHRIDVQIADQNNPSQLLGVVKDQTFDLIVDDGSHERLHQVTSMKTLLSFLKEDGVYVVEDLGTGPVESLHDLVDAVPPGFVYDAVKIVGGLGPKVQPHEWLFIVKRA